MVTYSGKSKEEVLNKNLFECFPEVPERWFKKKLDTVFMLRNYAFITWEQRQYLFKFRHSRPVTGGVEHMAQNITLMPMNKTDEKGEEQLCLTINDVTDTYVYQKMLEEANARLEMASQIDGLTQIYNRAYWERRLAEEFGRCMRYGSPLTLAMFDIDHFKSVNDRYGHLSGDEVIKFVAEIVQKNKREQDIFGRYGGEEFGLIYVNTPIDGAMVVSERIRKDIEDGFIQCDGLDINITISIGLCSLQIGMKNHEALIAAADNALYQSKNGGRNKVSVYDPNAAR